MGPGWRPDTTTDWPTDRQSQNNLIEKTNVTAVAPLPWGDLALQVGEISNETVKYGYGSYATRTCNCTAITDSSSRQRERPTLRTKQ
jgi:hypothetical protein